MPYESRLESPAAAFGRVARIPVRRARSRPRLEIALCDLRKLIRICGQIGFVPVQQLGQRRTRMFVARNALPLRVSGELGKYLRDVLQQFFALRWRKRTDCILDLMSRAHALIVSV